MAIVRWCLDPSEIVSLEYKQFAEMVRSSRWRNSQEKRLQAIWKLAVDSVGCEAGPTVEFEAKVMVEGLKQIRESIRQIEERIHEACSLFPEYESLLSIPGFGRDVASKVLGAIGNPFRFQNGREVSKLSGFDLCAKRSGKASESVIPVISRKGKADLRFALYQAALIASVQNPNFIGYYTAKLRGRERSRGSRSRCG